MNIKNNTHADIRNQYAKSLAASDLDEKILHLKTAFLLEDAALQFTHIYFDNAPRRFATPRKGEPEPARPLRLREYPIYGGDPETGLVFD